MNFEFSLVGLVFLIMLFVPNIIWTKYQPKDYDKYSQRESRILLAFERIGQILVVIFSLFCGAEFTYSLLLLIAFVLMVMYEIAWIRYFNSDYSMGDFYKDFLKVPLPLATLPVLAFFLLGIYANSYLLIISSLILAIGHIGIHFNHKKELL
ncbi:hypothetical protein [uncultured Methanobrevibacter sp.]|uniref:hypothetical protein n=1 Tax=uncultured Methanobrevibacter sp. TaxID=253161 RepID=UPI0025CCF3EA|nr:hypothetical protein [uncultured Methanobrevibacter sp.]